MDRSLLVSNLGAELDFSCVTIAMMHSWDVCSYWGLFILRDRLIGTPPMWVRELVELACAISEKR